MECINQNLVSSEDSISMHSGVKKEMLDIDGDAVLESVSCIKQEEDKEPPKSSYTDQQCAEVEAEIKEEPPDSYLETWQDGDACPSVNGGIDLNGDSDRFLQGKTEHKTAGGTPQAIRKRRGRKPRHKRQLSDQPFQCQTCQKCFKKKEQLRCHELFHSDERQFLCDTCGKGFYTNSDLKRHQVVHTGEKPYACHMCPKTFTQLCSLQSHLRKRCLIKGYGCDLCNRIFADKELLQKHKATHGTVPRRVNNVRKKPFCQDLLPFICDMCSLCFSNKRKLTTHIRQHMQGVLCLVCEFCGKKCSNRRRLIVHMRTHTGEKPFSCSVCGRSFSQQCNLKKHEALHLPD